MKVRLPRIHRVAGESMQPTLQPGDYVVSWPLGKLNRLKCGQTIVFRHARYGVLIKTVVGIRPEGLQVAGLNPRSTSSQDLGLVPLSNVLGRVVWTIRKR